MEQVLGAHLEPAPQGNAHTKLRKICACVMMLFLFSFLGWAFEKVYFYIAYGVNADRGFLTLPFCTVYGFSLLAIRALLGIPACRERAYPLNILSFLFYAALAGGIATFAELSTGLFFEQVFKISLWSYYGYPYTYQDYICLPVSIGWGLAIAFAMTAIWPPLERALSRLPLSLLVWTSGILSLSVTLDFFLTAFA